MNTSQLFDICKGLRYFGDVVALDIYMQRKKHRDMCIVNTDPSHLPGRHWFVVDRTWIPTVVFDSYGVLSPTGTDAFWRGYIKEYISFSAPLQSFSTNVCGDYSVMYVYLRHKGYSPLWIHSFLQNLCENDHIRDHIVRSVSSSEFNVYVSSGPHVTAEGDQSCLFL